MPETRLESGQMALLWQLAARARDASSEEVLGFTVVNETLALIPYRQAAWFRAPAHAGRGAGAPGVGGAVAAVSGLPQTDPGTPYVQWLTALCRALAQEGATPRRVSAADAPGKSAPEWSAWLPAEALWLPLADRSGRILGGLLFAREEPWKPAELAMFAELGQVWGHAFAAFGPHLSWTERAKALFGTRRRRRWAAAAVVLLCLAPIRLAALAPAQVTARDPFLVRSPLDGVIDKLYVRPNQEVAAGTPLLGLDPTTLESRYALAEKNYDAAAEEYRQVQQLAVTDDKARLDMEMTKGKLADSAVELQYSKAQLARVKVVAEKAGVAVFADANDWTGRAVAVGEKVMLIADPAKVEVTAYLPVADDIDVKPGGTLTLYPKSSPLASYDARIESVAYRAEPTAEGILAYKVKASFAPGETPPPLGVMGTARVHGGWVPLAYYLLRRPLTLARQWLGW